MRLALMETSDPFFFGLFTVTVSYTAAAATIISTVSAFTQSNCHHRAAIIIIHGVEITHSQQTHSFPLRL